MEYRILKYPQGKSIFGEGSVGECVYIIKNGCVEIYKHIKNKKVTLAEMKEGEIFGEMAFFLSGNIRTASARAKTHTELIELKNTSFKETLNKCPAIVGSVVKALTKRLRDTTANLSTRSTDKPFVSVCAIIALLLGSKCTQPHDTPCPYCTMQDTVPHEMAFEAIKKILMLTHEEISFYINKAVKMDLLKQVGRAYELQDKNSLMQRALEAYEELEESLTSSFRQDATYVDLFDLARETGLDLESLKQGLRELDPGAIVLEKEKVKAWVDSIRERGR